MVIVVMFTNLANELGPHPAVINGRSPSYKVTIPLAKLVTIPSRFGLW